ncbi:DUF4365 domain-containing protein [Vibrio parahaemolyticus]|nr:DUF4365 domain-containing protein [Vibrio parahaemolyticus]EHK0040512.1 DUF4365 domain-containing protein [Vibrio parahaemolyticus]
MTVPIQSIEESLSVAHVGAIVSRAGASFNLVTNDYGVDVSVRKIASYGGKLMDLGVAFDCQLKSSINWSEKGDHIIYDVEVDTYNKLIFREENSSTPCLLVLLCLPKEQSEWLVATDDSLILRKSCYFFHLKGIKTSNSSSKRIKIPKANLLTPEAVCNLLELEKSGELQ